MTCPHCVGIERFFDEKEARKDLKSYRKSGPKASAVKLLDSLKENDIEGATLLDIGGGIGALPQELFKAGLSTAVDVDGSSAYIAVAAEEAELLGTRDKLSFHQGNFIDIAPTLEEADIVTLDRVLCCFPDVDDMVVASTAKARRYYGLVYPRKTLGARFFIGLANAVMKAQRNPFRAFVHDPKRRIHAPLPEHDACMARCAIRTHRVILTRASDREESGEPLAPSFSSCAQSVKRPTEDPICQLSPKPTCRLLCLTSPAHSRCPA